MVCATRDSSPIPTARSPSADGAVVCWHNHHANTAFSVLSIPPPDQVIAELSQPRSGQVGPGGIVVCDRNRQASSTFLGSPLRRVWRSASLHLIRFSPATINRSACAVSAPYPASPKWLGPGRVSTGASSSCRNSSPPRHQPRSTRLNSPRKSCPPPPLHSLRKHPSPSSHFVPATRFGWGVSITK